MTDTILYAISVLSLFKALPETSSSDTKPDNVENIKHGFFITDEAAAKCSLASTPEVLSFITQKYGYDVEAMNNGLYHSFREVAKADEKALFTRQILHYMSVFLQNITARHMQKKSMNPSLWIPASFLF